MQTKDLLANQFKAMHRLWDDSMEGFSDETFNWRPAESRSLSAAFSAWHYLRTEDNIVGFVLQRRPTVWMTAGYDARFGLDSKAQGTGMTLEDAQKLQIQPLEEWKAYMKQVWVQTDEFVAAVDDEKLRAPTSVRPLGDMAVLDALSNMCIGHGYRHLGEVEYMRGLLNLGSASGI
ncbi:MAG: hypothetical protein GEU28_11945 [Dehalococcoidia bacterium]|nr:hypothetical protein [Dehalococcoidia bacterium]